MRPGPFQVLRAASRGGLPPAALPAVVIAGATGVLGNEVLRQLAGCGRYGQVDTAQWMLSTPRFMVPSSEQPVRAAKVAQLVASALQTAPPGIHVAAPELAWRASQGNLPALVAAWLGR